jgi:AraC-like DNA-binding protein
MRWSQPLVDGGDEDGCLVADRELVVPRRHGAVSFEAIFEVVARRRGLGTAANLRTLMRRETGITPSAYQRRFGPEAK